MTLTPTRKALLALAFVTLAVFAYSRIVGKVMSDEDRIKSIVRDMADAAEERDTQGIVRHLHPEFRSVKPSMDRDIAVAMMWHGFRQYREIRVSLPDLTVELQDDENAEARFLATLRIATTPGAKPEMQEMGRFRLTLTKVEGAWKVLTAEYVESTADRLE